MKMCSIIKGSVDEVQRVYQLETVNEVKEKDDALTSGYGAWKSRHYRRLDDVA